MQKSVPVYTFHSRFPLPAESDALRSKRSRRSDQQLHRVICPEYEDDFHRMFNFNLPAVWICHRSAQMQVMRFRYGWGDRST